MEVKRLRLSVFQINRRIIQVLNSCNRESFYALLNDLISIEDIFTSKWYLWNWIRTRDFYKMLSEWIANQIQNEREYNYEKIIHDILTTTKHKKVKETFIWNLTKRVNILTVDTIQYTSEERIKNILQKHGEKLYVDDHLKPFLEAIVEYRTMNMEEET